MIALCSQLLDILNSGNSAAIITVLDKKDSSSKEAGKKMIVKDDFTISGTIGGGLLEALAMKLASVVFENKSYLIRNSSPMLSAEYVGPEDKSAMGYFNEMAEYIEHKKNFTAVTRFVGKDEIRREFLFEDSSNLFRIEEHKDEILFYCPVLNVDCAYIFGAGYIGQSLAKLTSMMGFHTVVLDNRHEFANNKRFPDADRIIVLDSFKNAGRYISIDQNSYIIIATRGHAEDMYVLGEVLRSNARYIGMLGSRKKRDEAYEKLIRRGFNTEELKKIHSPIGLDINAVTPEDITISIAAELVMVRRKSNE